MGVVFDTLPTNMGKKQGSAKSAQLGLDADRETDFGKWYIQVITRAELIEYYDISGCYVLRPNAYEIWEEVQRVLNNYIKESGVRNCYFPSWSRKLLSLVKNPTWRDSLLRSPGSPALVTASWVLLWPSVPPVRRLCTLSLLVGSTLTVIFPSVSTNGPMWSVGSSRTPCLSFVPVNSCGKRVTLFLPHKRKPTLRCWRSWITTKRSMRSSWLFLSSLDASQRRRSSPALTTQPPAKLLFPITVVRCKVPPRIVWEELSAARRCSTLPTRLMTRRPCILSRTLGVSPPAPLVWPSCFTVTTRV